MDVDSSVSADSTHFNYDLIDGIHSGNKAVWTAT